MQYKRFGQGGNVIAVHGELAQTAGQSDAFTGRSSCTSDKLT
jgi:hypothetical protein